MKRSFLVYLVLMAMPCGPARGESVGGIGDAAELAAALRIGMRPPGHDVPRQPLADEQEALIGTGIVGVAVDERRPRRGRPFGRRVGRPGRLREPDR